MADDAQNTPNSQEQPSAGPPPASAAGAAPSTPVPDGTVAASADAAGASVGSPAPQASEPVVAPPTEASVAPSDSASPELTPDSAVSASGESANEPFEGFSQDDIDALLAAGGGEAGGSQAVEHAAAPATAPGTVAAASVSPQVAIDARVAGTQAGAAGKPKDSRVDSEGRAFDDAAAEMAAAIEAERGASVPKPSPLELPNFSSKNAAPATRDISVLRDVNLHVQIELGRTHMYIEDVLRLTEGSVVELDNLAGDPVDVIVNGRKVARGEVLVLSDNFCVRISEIITGPQIVAVV